jgi:hypothetical protein
MEEKSRKTKKQTKEAPINLKLQRSIVSHKPKEIK